MQNWRHSGRFNAHFVPLATDGTTSTAGDKNMGTANAPWANAYIATGGSLYVGGTAFEGGGGGAAIEVFEQQSHIEKMGYEYPLSNPQSFSESFVNSSAMVISLGKTHANTETTIYLDRDADTISAIDTHSATGWAVAPTGACATNTTAGQSVNGTSIKYTVTATDTSYFMAHSFTSFSMVDQDLKVWLYPDTVANVTHALVRLYSAATTTGFAEWQIPVATITALSLNSLYMDVDNPTTSGAEYIRGSVNQVQLGAKGTTTPQAINWSWNFVRSVDNRALKLPVRMVCDNNTNQEFINVTTATVAGDVHTLDTITTYSHTLSSTEIKLKQLDIANGQGKIASGTSGEAALTGWDISRQFFDTSTTGDLIITSRWWDENYQVATVTNASTTVLTVETTTVAAGYKSGDVVRLYTWEYIDQDYQSPQNASIGSNFLDLTLTADGGTTSSTELTLTHGNTSNQNLGGVAASKWQGIRISADDYYRVEAATQSQALIKATTDIFIPKGDFIPYPSGVLSHWKLDELSGNAIDALGNQDLTDYGGVGSGGSPYGRARGGNYATGNPGVGLSYFTGAVKGSYDSESLPFMVECLFKITNGAIGSQMIFNKGDVTGNVGWWIRLGSTEQMTFSIATTDITAGANVHNDGKWHYAVGWLKGLGANEMFFYIDNVLIGQVTRAGWTYSGDGLAVGVNNDTSIDPDLFTEPVNGFVRDCVFWNTPYTTQAAVEDYMSRRWNNGNMRALGSDTGFIQKSTIADVSGNKLITGTRLTRKDATNQDPIIYQRNAVII